MSKKLQNLTLSFFSLAVIVLVFGSYVIVAQTVITGDWTAKTNTEKNDKIYLSFERRSEKGGTNQMGQSYEFAELQGLSREQALSSGAVKFSLVREAGTIDCEGNFNNGKGAGTFRFTANPQFVSAMKSRGFDFEKGSSKNEREPENRLFAAATLNLTTAFTDDLLSADFGKLDIDDLFKARIFNITPQFMQEMKATGFSNLGMEDLVKARIFKIDASYVRQISAAGFNNEPFESLVKMRIFKITPEFINEVRSAGFNNLSVEELVKMKIFKIDAEFIRSNPNLSVEDLVKKRIGVWGK
ncbi:MAG: hypothetical protein H0W58_01175 [Acidobacteria bacterium]|jgi:hypothetical protein|nr:hypothetical protein [Acidobacteriota bacterium]